MLELLHTAVSFSLMTLRDLCWLFQIAGKCYLFKKSVLLFYLHTFCDIDSMNNQEQFAYNQFSKLILHDLKIINREFNKYEKVQIR